MDKKPRASSKADREAALLNRLQQWMEEGDTPEHAVEKLSMKQYDFLIDRGVNLDNLILTPQQQLAVAALTKAKRPSGLVYVKKYPQAKQDLYNALIGFLEEYGADGIEPAKNFRDLEFQVDAVKYKIVLSNPRPPKAGE